MPSLGEARFVTVKGRQGAYLAALTSGATRKDALTAAGLVSPNTIVNWRRKYPDFAQQERVLTSARMRGGLRPTQRIHPKSRDPVDMMSPEVFAHWRKEMFGFDTYYHQRMIVRELHAAMVAKDLGIVLILVAPDHGKTTTLVDWACRRLSVEDNLRMVVLQENQKRGRRFLGRVKGRMTTNGPYIADHGRPFYVAGQEKSGKVWSADAIKLYDFDADEADFSLEALGWTSQVSGQRIDCLIVDDIQSLKSLSRTAQMFEIFQQDFLSRITTDKGMIVVVGTRVGPGDFYEKLMNEGLVDRTIELPAHNGTVTDCELGEECTHPELTHYEPLAPEMITPHKLMNKERHVGKSAWARNWMQRPQDDSTAPFPAPLVDAAYDDNLDIGQLRPGGATVLGIDPAIVGNCVLAVGGYYPDRIELIDMVIRSDLGSTDGIFNMIEQSVQRYHPQTVVIETNSWQILFQNDSRLRAMAKTYGFRIEPNDTGKLKNDEVLGVATMANSLGRGELVFTGTEAGRRRLELFDAEVKAWRPYVRNSIIAHDTVMATWFIWRYWYEQRHRAQPSSSDFASPRRLPWTPTGTTPVQSSEAAQFARHLAQERQRGLVRVEG